MTLSAELAALVPVAQALEAQVPVTLAPIDIGAVNTIYATPDEVWDGQEFMSSAGHRDTGALGDIDFRSPHMTQVNVTVHDVKNVAWTKAAHGGLRDGCHFYNIGWVSNQGQAMYDQHEGAETRLYRNCIIGANYAYGIHAYGSQTIRNLTFQRCISHDSGAIFGGGGVEDITLEDCVLWLPPAYGAFQAGYGSTLNHRLKLSRCTLYGTLWALNVDELEVTDCTIISATNPLRWQTVAGYLPLTTTFARNRYFGANYFRAIPIYTGGKTFAEYQTLTGFDADSTFTPGLPTVNDTFVFPATYSPRIAHLASINWEQLDAVDVDVSALPLVKGRQYVLKSSYDPVDDVHAFTYDGAGVLTVSMLNRTVAIPIGASAPLLTPDKRFGAWLLCEA